MENMISDRHAATHESLQCVTAGHLGSASFRQEYGLKYAYLAGAMYKGIASVELVTAMGKAGMMGYFGTGGLTLEETESAIRQIRDSLADEHAFGMNLLANVDRPEEEMSRVELYLQHNVRFVEASAYMNLTAAVVRYRLHGLKQTDRGIIGPNRLLVKLSRPEVASVFMRPAPEEIVRELLQAGHISREEAELAKRVPVAQDICVEADSAGHTDRGNAYILLPTIRRLAERISHEQGYTSPFHIGAAGGIGTPEAALAAFILGADFIETGSINQCTVESGTSEAVKAMLQHIDVQDTTYAPAGDMFELGARVQVLKRGLFFPARANKLYDLYTRYNALEEIDEKTQKQIQEKYFKRSFDDVWLEVSQYVSTYYPELLKSVIASPKKKMALIFRWYFNYSSQLALRGSDENVVDYQVHCGPALGAFNQWVRHTPREKWHNRRVADIALLIMNETARMLNDKIAIYIR